MKKMKKLIGEIITDSKLVTITMDKSFKTQKEKDNYHSTLKQKKLHPKLKMK